MSDGDPRAGAGTHGAPSGIAAVGGRLQGVVNAVQQRTAPSPAQSVLLGVMLAAMVVAGGLLAFLLVWAVLVGFFA